jgi:hypothetical protein
MGLKVKDEKEDVSGLQGQSLREHLHFCLDHILDEMLTGPDNQRGGEASVLIPCDKNHDHILRLTVCDFTGEQPCGHCGGTGAEPTEDEGDVLDADEVEGELRWAND